MAATSPQTIAKNYLQDHSEALQGYAVANYDQSQFIKSAMIAFVGSPQIMDCLKTPAGKDSVFQALRFAAATGLSLNPQEGKAAIIAYSGKAQYQIMKNGLVELAQRSGKVKFITQDTVRENDIFEIEKTANGDKYTFKPHRKDRGGIDGFFAAIVLNDGICSVKYMTKKEIEDFRDSYSAMYKNKPQASPWNHSFEGMGIKTVLKALLRNISISPEISVAVGSDDAAENVVEKNITPVKGHDAESVINQIESKPEPGPEPEVVTGEVQQSGDKGSF